jgi:DNA (cytosine-5)-methyltransferase 1
MWGEMARIIHEVRPKFVFVENSPMLTSRGLGRVLGDLATMGFDARWGVLGAADIGAPHQRDRIWIVAQRIGQFPHAQHNRIRWWEQQQKSIKEEARKVTDTPIIRSSEQTNKCILESKGGDEFQLEQSRDTSEVANTGLSGLTPCNHQALRPKQQLLEEQSWRSRNEFGSSQYWWEAEPNVGRVVDGVASRVDRLKAIGNGQVPLCAATAWRILSESN